MAPARLKVKQVSLLTTLLLALFVVLLAAAVAVTLIKWGASPWSALGVKILEFSIQLVLVTLLGGVLVQAYIRWQARASSINEFRKTTAEALIREYSAVKKVRRLIRATCIHGKGGTPMDPWTDIPLDVYDKHMACINDAQLSLELLKRRLKLLGEPFKEMRKRAETMEDYLSNIIGEYERRRRLGSEHGPIPLKDLERLQAFIAGKPDENPISDFNKFRNPFDELLDLIETKGIWVAI